MKTACLLLALTSLHAFAGSSDYTNFVRQNQQETGVVWDMPVAPDGSAPSALLMDNGGALFQLWTIDTAKAKDYLLDQKLVGVYLPKADIRIAAADSWNGIPRTRVDQPFTVEISVAGLLQGKDLPAAATQVLGEQHIASYAAGQSTLNPTTVAANTPLASAYISTNGVTTYKFPASSLRAADPTKATGEEHFIVHALSDGSFAQTQIASAKIQILPVASGAILGITPGAVYRYRLPTVQLNLDDLYPRSDSSLMLYEGSSVSGAGTLVKGYPMDRETINSIILEAPELDSKIARDGTYTLALMSKTVFGTELLCDPVTFSVKRSISVNAMQVNFQGK